MDFSQRIKRAVKAAVARVWLDSGLIWRYLDTRRSGKAAVLMYHRIVDRDAGVVDYAPGGMDVSRETFERHMAFVAGHFNVISFGELCDLARSGQAIPPRTCVITFDDGWRDNYDNAFPVLQRHGLPATIFLAVNYVENGEWYWLERFRFLMSQVVQMLRRPELPPANRERILACMSEHGIGAPPESGDQDAVAYWLMDQGKEVADRPESDVSRLMSDLEDLYELPESGNARLFLNWSEIGEMAEAGIEFGSHTMSHSELNSLDGDAQAAELKESKREIERHLGRTVTTLAYPYGKHDATTRRLATELGYAGACSTKLGLVDPSSDQFAMERISIHEQVSDTLPLFACRISRLLGIY